jgi:hypothetical protein
MAQAPLTVRRWKRTEYDRLVDLGAFEDEPLELIAGQLIVAEPKGAYHSSAVTAADYALRAALPPGWLVRNQQPVSLDDEPVDAHGSRSPARDHRGACLPVRRAAAEDHGQRPFEQPASAARGDDHQRDDTTARPRGVRAPLESIERVQDHLRDSDDCSPSASPPQTLSLSDRAPARSPFKSRPPPSASRCRPSNSRGAPAPPRCAGPGAAAASRCSGRRRRT